MGGSISILVNGKVNKITVFIKERENPFLVSSVTKLHHFLTRQIVNEEDASPVLDINQSGQIEYIQFREEGFMTKEKKLSDTIKKIILPSFNEK